MMSKAAAIVKAKKAAKDKDREYVVITEGMGYFIMSYSAWVNSTAGDYTVRVTQDGKVEKDNE